MILDSLPAAATNGRLVTNLTRRPAIPIDGLIVADNRGRRLVLQTMDVVVERCAIQGCTGAGIHLVCDASDFYESSGTTKVRIANNTLTGVNQGAVVGSAACTRAAIAIAAELDNQLAPAGSHSQIDLVGNTIRDTTRSAIHVGSAFQTNIIGNVFDNVCTAAAPSSTAPTAHMIWIEKSAETVITGNTLLLGASRIRTVGQSNATGVVVSHNTGF